ncbi:MAG: hypothetical protein AAF414_19535 [Pseudomonadota bacterium]
MRQRIFRPMVRRAQAARTGTPVDVVADTKLAVAKANFKKLVGEELGDEDARLMSDTALH